MMKTRTLLIALLVLAIMTGCSQFSNPTTSIPPTGTLTNTETPTPTVTATVTSTIPPPTPTIELISQVCSPIQGIDFSELPLIQSWEYISPTPYVESGHPAIDFGQYHFKDYPFFPNFPVQSIISGKAILVQQDLSPYGNMILIETPLNNIKESFLSSITKPTPLPPSIYSIDERCPVSGPEITWDSEGKSLYVLYAHMLEKPEVSPGDPVSCGQLIGIAGKSGHAAEEHLHLEIRIGPSNASFESIAAQGSADITPVERYNYCIWALSGVFQAINPATLLYP
jgi:murein DD-endopeptidase MepM/ murein hydrolase activator NlpD